VLEQSHGEKTRRIASRMPRPPLPAQRSGDGVDKMTNKEAADLLGCSVSTARRWSCARCGQDYLSIAHRRCGTIYGPEKCNTDELVRKFKDRRP
jgi:hypothetical protein